MAFLPDYGRGQKFFCGFCGHNNVTINGHNASGPSNILPLAMGSEIYI